MKITAEMILEKTPCYEWVDRLKNEFAGQEKTLIEILQMDDIPPEGRLWVATQFLSERQNRLFAVWCAREALTLVKNPDPRSVAACDIAERFARGEATAEELAAAALAAAAAHAAAFAADAADVAAARAAHAAARAAAAAHAAAIAAALAADAADAAAALAAQIKKLIEMLEKEEAA